MFAIDLGNGLTIAGEVKTGLEVKSLDDGVDDTTDIKVSPRNDDAGQIFRTRLTAAYEGDWGGAKIRFQSFDLGGDNAAYFHTKYAYGWANFLDKKVVVYGGDIGDDLWGLGKLSINIFDPSLDGIKGVRAAFNIVDGLTFGFGLPFDPVTYYSYETEEHDGWVGDSDPKWTKDGIKTSDFQSKTANRTLGAIFGGAVFGGVYKSDLFSVAAALRLYPAIDSKEYGGQKNAADKYAENDAYAEVVAGVEVHPIAPLKVVVDSKFDTRKFDKDLLGWASQTGYSRVGLKAQYDVTSRFNVHLQGTIFAPMDKADREGAAVTIDDVPVTSANFAGAGDYGAVETLGDVALAPRIGVDYKLTDTIGVYFQFGSDNIFWIAGQELDGTDPYIAGAGVYVKLGGKITLGTSSIEIFDKINKLGAAEEKIGTEDVSKVENVFQIDFNWSF